MSWRKASTSVQKATASQVAPGQSQLSVLEEKWGCSTVPFLGQGPGEHVLGLVVLYYLFLGY